MTAHSRKYDAQEGNYDYVKLCLSQIIKLKHGIHYKSIINGA